jgi:hypothetical protein
MKIKFNWGTAIVLVIVLFFLSIAIRVCISYQHEINLVEEDYYSKELTYQDHIDKENNTDKLENKPRIELRSDTLFLQFPDEFKNKNIQGNIHLYRPSDKYLDKHFALDPDEHLQQTFHINNLQRGRYELKMDWTVDTVAYFLKQDISVY